MRTNLWKRAAALFVAGALAVSMFAMSASAKGFDQWQKERKAFQPFVDDLNQARAVDYLGDRTGSILARYDDLTALIQKYPSYADAYYERASFAHSYFDVLATASKATLAEVISDVNTAITLAEQNLDGYYRNGGEWNDGRVFLANTYDLRARIALDLEHQQQGYLDFMQKAVDLREQYYINFFKTADSNWNFGENMCQNARAKQQLEEIRAWSASGAKEFQTIDGHVQVTGGVGDTVLTIVETLSDGSIVTQTFDCYGQPIQQVLRSVDAITIVLPPRRVASMHYVRKDASGAVVEDYTQTAISFSQTIGTLQDFPSCIPAEMPQKVKTFLEQNGLLSRRTVSYQFYQKNS